MSSTARLGLFIIVTLLILATGVFLIGDKESMFSSTYQVKSDFQNVAGLDAGADVRVGGIRTGVVNKIVLPKGPNGGVTVVMNLDGSTRGIVKKDSIASIQSEGLLGDKYVEVSFGSDDAPRLKSGDTIGSVPPFEFSQLTKKADHILDTTERAMASIQDTASNLSSISGKINRGQGTVGALVNDKTVYKQAAAGATALHEDAEALKHNFLLRGFFKDRGYQDASELTKNEVSALPASPPSKVFDYNPTQLFDKPDTAKLKNQKLLDEAAKFLQSQKFSLVVIACSSGAKGDTEKDRTLTQARSTVIRDYLINNFRMDDTKVKTLGLGKSEDSDSKGSVEIVIYPQATP